jgi:hypothetical protein
MKKIAAAIMLITLPSLTMLSACAEETAPTANPQYVLPNKINLDVQSLNLVDQSGPQPIDSPYNKNHFQPTITEAIRQWANDRLQAVGSTGQGTVVIRDASLVQQAIPHSDSMFKRQQASKYVAHADVEIEVRGREGSGIASAQANRYVSLPEDPNAIEKQKAYFEVLNGLMRDLGTNLESAIQGHLHDFVITAPIMDNGASRSSPMAPSAPSPMAPSSYPVQ